MDILSNNKSSYYKENFESLTYLSKTIQDREFENCTFEKCRFVECVFENCKFIDCTFSNCSLSAIKPFNSQFTDIVFKDSKIMGLDWTKAKNIRQLTFERCDLSYSNFSLIKLHNLKLLECVAKDVKFDGADLSLGVFTKTDFSNSIFSNTNLTGTDFRKAFNYDINFNFNKLTKAKFSIPEALSLLNSLDIILEN